MRSWGLWSVFVLELFAGDLASTIVIPPLSGLTVQLRNLRCKHTILTTSARQVQLKHVVTGEEIMIFQNLVRKIPVADNVLNYAVSLATKTRPNTPTAPKIVNDYITWGAGPRASQYLVLGAKCHAAIRGKYSPDIEDVQAVAAYVLRHRVVVNYKAEAAKLSADKIVRELF